VAPGIPSIVPMGLLVSVRNLDEANRIADRPIAILDVKEPGAGPLGAASTEIWQSIADRHGDSVVLSAALGEYAQASKCASGLPAEYRYAKMGCERTGSTAQLCDRWAELDELISPATELVAVAYADHAAAQCSPAICIFEAAAASGYKTWLIDTFVKDGVSTIDHLGVEGLRRIDALAVEAGASWVLAGSVAIPVIDWLRRHELRPRYVGVRGAVCDGHRDGPLNATMVDNWLTSLPTTDQVSVQR